MRSSRNCDVRLVQRRPAPSRRSREWPTLPAEPPHVSGCADPGHRARHRRWRRFRTVAFLCLSYTYAPQVLHAFGKLGSGSMLARTSKRVSERIHGVPGWATACLRAVIMRYSIDDLTSHTYRRNPSAGGAFRSAIIARVRTGVDRPIRAVLSGLSCDDGRALCASCPAMDMSQAPGRADRSPCLRRC
jgi:hypothetical protein